MTDEELIHGYSGYTDRELANFIASGIQEEQANDLSRLLVLRRRSHYTGHIHQQPEDPKKVTQPQPPSLPTGQQPKEPPKQPTSSSPTPKNKKGGCLRTIFIFILIAVLIFFGLLILAMSSPN